VEIKLGYSLFKLSFLYRIFGKISTIAERGHCVTFYNLSWFSENIKPLEILSVKFHVKTVVYKLIKRLSSRDKTVRSFKNWTR